EIPAQIRFPRQLDHSSIDHQHVRALLQNIGTDIAGTGHIADQRSWFDQLWSDQSIGAAGGRQDQVSFGKTSFEVDGYRHRAIRVIEIALDILDPLTDRSIKGRQILQAVYIGADAPRGIGDSLFLPLPKIAV